MIQAPTGPRKRRVAILGGGLGALAAAYELADQPGAAEKYDITVYQMGWRLGGKCASGRNMRDGYGYRVEEHGIHVLFGFYENTFYLLRRAYDVLKRPPGMRIHSWNTALRPLRDVVWAERRDGKFEILRIPFPRSPGSPGLAAKRYREWRLPFRGKHPPTVLGQLMAWIVAGIRQLATPEFQGSLPQRACHLIAAVGHGIGDCVSTSFTRRRRRLRECIRAAIKRDVIAERFWIMLQLGIVTLRGIIADGVIFKGFDHLNEKEFEQWLTDHGASADLLESPFIRSGYDAAFGFTTGHLIPDERRCWKRRRGAETELVPSIAAGTALRAAVRSFGYHGSALWKPQAGTGDVLCMPLYEVLRARGVKFRFFHRVTGLHLSRDRKRIQGISISQQVRLKDGPAAEYVPQVCPDGDGLPCWPSEPNWCQIEDADAVRAELDCRGRTLEDAPPEVPANQSSIELEYGRDDELGFDDVILGISIGGLHELCGELVSFSKKWRTMLCGVPTTATTAFQLWLKKPLPDLGWGPQYPPHPMLAGLTEPIDTWVDMTHLRERESHPDTRTVAYFCGPFVDAPDDPDKAAQAARKHAAVFLKHELPEFWSRVNGNLDELLVVPHSASGSALDAQHWRANVVGSERYVQSSPGTIKYRLPSEDSGFENLFLAGDWTNNGLNMGCAEAAVMSGMQAARGVTRNDPKRSWITVWGEKDLPL